MPHNPTYPITLDVCKTINIHDLQKFGYLAPAQLKNCIISWQQGSGQSAEIYITINTIASQPHIIIEYTYNKEDIKYEVALHAKPSNLGKGFLWYFICPQAGRLCTKLYFNNNYFLHRQALGKAMYHRQTLTSTQRNLVKQFLKTETLETADTYLNAKYRKTRYNGKPTKKLIAIQKLLNSFV